MPVGATFPQSIGLDVYKLCVKMSQPIQHNGDLRPRSVIDAFRKVSSVQVLQQNEVLVPRTKGIQTIGSRGQTVGNWLVVVLIPMGLHLVGAYLPLFGHRSRESTWVVTATRNLDVFDDDRSG